MIGSVEAVAGDTQTDYGLGLRCHLCVGGASAGTEAVLVAESDSTEEQIYQRCSEAGGTAILSVILASSCSGRLLLILLGTCQVADQVGNYPTVAASKDSYQFHQN
jgi:hypothetical protein